MNAIERLRTAVLTVVPDVVADLDRPNDPNGRWFLDLHSDAHHVVVEWVPSRGFGVSASNRVALGEGPEETHADLAAASERVVHLLRTGETTRLPRSVRLSELRAGVARLTQEALAARLGIQQAAVSKIERRSDTTIGTLQRVVRALGGELEIIARFPDESVVITQFDEANDSGH